MMLRLRGIDDEGMPINRFIYVDRDKVLEVADHIAVSGWRYARLEYDGIRVGELVYSVAQKRSIWIWGSTQTANLPAQNQFRQSIVRRLRAGLESASTRGRTLTRTEQATPGAAGLQEDTVAEAGEGKTRPTPGGR